jgi:hypothetical protein
MCADIIADDCIIRLGFMLFVYGVIWPRNFSVDRAPSALRLLV